MMNRTIDYCNEFLSLIGYKSTQRLVRVEDGKVTILLSKEPTTEQWLNFWYAIEPVKKAGLFGYVRCANQGKEEEAEEFIRFLKSA